MKKHLKPLIAVLGTFIFCICSILISLAVANDEHPQIQASDHIARKITPMEYGPPVSVLDAILLKSKSKEYFKKNLTRTDITDVECLAFVMYAEAPR